VVGFCLAALFALGATKAVKGGDDPFICRKVGDFTDIRDCSKFYRCKAEGAEGTHLDCPKDKPVFNPWVSECTKEDKDFMCKVYDNPPAPKEVYYIKACSGDNSPFCTAPDAEAECGGSDLKLAAIKNWDIDVFMYSYTKEFESRYHPGKDEEFTYWTCGRRTEASTPLNRDFIWDADGSHMTYTSWCDVGLMQKKGHPGSKFPDNCRPDDPAHNCVHLNTTYVHDYGWWDTAPCKTPAKNVALCQHFNPMTTTEGPTPTPTTPTDITTTPTDKTTTDITTTPTDKTTTDITTPNTPTTSTLRPPTTPLSEEVFLPFTVCPEVPSGGKNFTFCEHYKECKSEGAIPTEYRCYDETFPLFDENAGECINREDFQKKYGDICDMPTNECYGPGMFADRRYCGRFHMCMWDRNTYIKKTYECPLGWVYDNSTSGLCIRMSKTNHYEGCPYEYDIIDDERQEEPDDSTQCTEEGLKAYDDPKFLAYDDDFIQCAYKKDGKTLGQIGPMMCHDPLKFDDRKNHCVKF